MTLSQTTLLSGAINYILEHVEKFLSFEQADLTCCFVPVDHTASASRPSQQGSAVQPPMAAAFTVAQLLYNLPHHSTADRLEHAEHRSQVVEFLSRVLLGELCWYGRAVMGGGASCPPLAGGDGGPPASGSAGRRTAFVVWLSLSIYRRFVDAAAAECDGDDTWYGKRLRTVAAAFDTAVQSDESRRHDADTNARVMRTHTLVGILRAVQDSLYDASGEPRSADWQDLLSVNESLFADFFSQEVVPLLSRIRRHAPSVARAVVAGVQLAPAPDVFRSLQCRFDVHPLSPAYAAALTAAAAVGTILGPLAADCGVQGSCTTALRDARVALQQWPCYVEECRTASVSAEEAVAACSANIHVAEGCTEQGRRSAERRSRRRLASLTRAACDYQDTTRHALSVVDAALQFVPTSPFATVEVLGCGDNDGTPCEPPPGTWLVDLTRDRRARAGAVPRLRALLPPRACVLLPGLAIAATETEAHTISVPWAARAALETLVQGSTLLVSPPGARRTMLVEFPSSRCSPVCLGTRAHRLPHDEMASGRAGMTYRPKSTADAYTVPSESLRLVHALVLFTELPPVQDGGQAEPSEPLPDSTSPALTWPALSAAVDRFTRQPGCVVVFAVKSHLDAPALASLEAMGSPTRIVVAVGSVGEWGMTQLALRFDCLPNTPQTSAEHLRVCTGLDGCDPASRAGSCRVCPGVCLVELDETALTREMREPTGPARPANESVWTGPPSKPTISFVEVRRRLVVVIGATHPTAPCEPSAARKPSAAGMPQRPAMVPDSEESSSSEDTDDKSCSTGSVDRASSTSSASSLPSPAALRRPSDTLPAVGYVCCSMLVGGVTPAIQTERLVLARRVFQQLTHTHLLPADQSALLPGRGSVELLVHAHMERILQNGGKASPSQGLDGAHPQPSATQLFRTRLAEALQAACWDYLRICEQRQSGATAEDAWATLAARGRTPLVATPDECVDDETTLEVRAAYQAVGACLDVLCRTTLWL